MAETKTKARASSGRGSTTKRKPSKARKTSRTKSSNGASASQTAKPRAKKAKGSPASKNGSGRVDAARGAIGETAKNAGHSVGDAASSVGRVAGKAKTPLLAGSAAAAGIAGGLALGARQSRNSKMLPRRPKVKIDSHDLAKAAKEVGQFGADVGQLALELRKNREAANGSTRRSPIEVVLQGLTSRDHGSS
jgi:hypothetical protein